MPTICPLHAAMVLPHQDHLVTATIFYNIVPIGDQVFPHGDRVPGGVETGWVTSRVTSIRADII